MWYYSPAAILFVYSFAAKPKKGVKFLQEHQLLGHTPQDVARFFFDDERLDKVCI